MIMAARRADSLLAESKGGSILPNFFIIGAAKSGTSSLYRYLAQHPQIFTSPKKEPSYFALPGVDVKASGPGDQQSLDELIVTDRAEYEALFSEAGDASVIGEGSVMYLYYPEVAQRIRREVPDARLIAILRNPVDRAYSCFRHLRRDGREPREVFADALALEDSRIEAGWEHLWHYTRGGFYFEQLSRYYDVFPPEQISVHMYEDLQMRPLELVGSIFRFLGVDDTFQPDLTIRRNVSGMPRSRRLHRFLRQPSTLKATLSYFVPRAVRERLYLAATDWNVDSEAESGMPPEVREQLSHLFESDIDRLSQLIGRDLSGWLVA